MSDDSSEGQGLAPNDQSKPPAKRPYERPAVTWTEELRLGSSQFCAKNPAEGGGCDVSSGFS